MGKSKGKSKARAAVRRTISTARSDAARYASRERQAEQRQALHRQRDGPSAAQGILGLFQLVAQVRARATAETAPASTRTELGPLRLAASVRALLCSSLDPRDQLVLTSYRTHVPRLSVLAARVAGLSILQSADGCEVAMHHAHVLAALCSASELASQPRQAARLLSMFQAAHAPSLPIVLQGPALQAQDVQSCIPEPPQPASSSESRPVPASWEDVADAPAHETRPVLRASTHVPAFIVRDVPLLTCEPVRQLIAAGIGDTVRLLDISGSCNGLHGRSILQLLPRMPKLASIAASHCAWLAPHSRILYATSSAHLPHLELLDIRACGPASPVLLGSAPCAACAIKRDHPAGPRRAALVHDAMMEGHGSCSACIWSGHVLVQHDW